MVQSILEFVTSSAVPPVLALAVAAASFGITVGRYTRMKVERQRTLHLVEQAREELRKEEDDRLGKPGGLSREFRAIIAAQREQLTHLPEPPRSG
jgi:hypothetical protein